MTYAQVLQWISVNYSPEDFRISENDIQNELSRDINSDFSRQIGFGKRQLISKEKNFSNQLIDNFSDNDLFDIVLDRGAIENLKSQKQAQLTIDVEDLKEDFRDADASRRREIRNILKERGETSALKGLGGIRSGETRRGKKAFRELTEL